MNKIKYTYSVIMIITTVQKATVLKHICSIETAAPSDFFASGRCVTLLLIYYHVRSLEVDKGS